MEEWGYEKEEVEEELDENQEAGQTLKSSTNQPVAICRWNIKYENEGELGGAGIPPKVFPPEQWVENGGLAGSRGAAGQKLAFYFRPQPSLSSSLIISCKILRQIRRTSLTPNFRHDNWHEAFSNVLNIKNNQNGGSRL